MRQSFRAMGFTVLLLGTPHPVLGQTASGEIEAVQSFLPTLDWPDFVIPQDIPEVDPASPNAQAVSQANGGDVAGALQAFLTLAEEGVTAAKVNAGAILYRGREVNPDYKRAVSLLEDAASEGDSFANLLLGRLYYEGLAVDRSPAKANEYFMQANKGPAAPEASWWLANIQGLLGSDLGVGIDYCLGAYSLGHRLAIESCQDFGPFSLEDFITPRVRQTEFALRLAPWYDGTFIEHQYVAEAFSDNDRNFRQKLEDSAPGYQKYYNYDVMPQLGLIGEATVRAAELAETATASSQPSLASETKSAGKSKVAAVLADTAVEPNVKRVIDEHLDATCDVGPAVAKDGTIQSADLNSDGITDVVVDLGFVECGNSDRSLSCGFRTCEILVFLGRDGDLELVETFTSIGVEVVEGARTRLKLVSHDFQTSEVAWNGSGFSGPQAPPSAATEGVWQYGEHPVLGLSAFVPVGDEAIGIACAYTGDSPAVVDLSSIRVTPGLVDDDAITLLVEPSRAGGTRRLQRNGGFFEVKGNSCDLNTMEWRGGSSVSVLDTPIMGIRGVDGGTLFELENGMTVGPADDALNVAGGISVPLKGSAAAIDQLLRACPMLQQDIDWECGL